jgi:Zn-dependent protease with chaperone function
VSWHDSALHAAGNAVLHTPFQNLWPLVAAPGLAALVSDRSARFLARTPQASWPAAILAAAPGLAGLGVIWQALQWDVVRTWHGLVMYRITPLVAAGLAAYAVMRALQRQAEVARLFAAAAAPSDRLRRAADRLGLRARQLATADKECFVAGLLRPTVFVSTGALDQLTDDELDAALCHERAHVRGYDTPSLFALSLLRDLAPWGRGAALEAFRAAREANADRQAATSAGPLNLASALVALARPGPALAAGALPMARNDSLRWRMQALLETEAPPEPGPQRFWPGLALCAALVAWPAAQLQVMWLFCESR